MPTVHDGAAGGSRTSTHGGMSHSDIQGDLGHLKDEVGTVAHDAWQFLNMQFSLDEMIQLAEELNKHFEGYQHALQARQQAHNRSREGLIEEVAGPWVDSYIAAGELVKNQGGELVELAGEAMMLFFNLKLLWEALLWGIRLLDLLMGLITGEIAAAFFTGGATLGPAIEQLIESIAEEGILQGLSDAAQQLGEFAFKRLVDMLTTSQGRGEVGEVVGLATGFSVGIATHVHSWQDLTKVSTWTSVQMDSEMTGSAFSKMAEGNVPAIIGGAGGAIWAITHGSEGEQFLFDLDMGASLTSVAWKPVSSLTPKQIAENLEKDVAAGDAKIVVVDDATKAYIEGGRQAQEAAIDLQKGYPGIARATATDIETGELVRDPKKNAIFSRVVGDSADVETVNRTAKQIGHTPDFFERDPAKGGGSSAPSDKPSEPHTASDHAERLAHAHLEGDAEQSDPERLVEAHLNGETPPQSVRNGPVDVPEPGQSTTLTKPSKYAIGVNLKMCASCRRYFLDVAKAKDMDLVVSDSEATRIFFRNGDLGYVTNLDQSKMYVYAGDIPRARWKQLLDIPYWRSSPERHKVFP